MDGTEEISLQNMSFKFELCMTWILSANLNSPRYSSKPVYADPNQMYDTPASPGNQEGKKEVATFPIRTC